MESEKQLTFMQKYKNYVLGYLIILVIAFNAGPYLGLVTHEWRYNITCLDGEVEWFNESTEIVCGGDNPLYATTKDNYKYKDVNYLEVYNHSFNLT